MMHCKKTLLLFLLVLCPFVLFANPIIYGDVGVALNQNLTLGFDIGRFIVEAGIWEKGLRSGDDPLFLYSLSVGCAVIEKQRFNLRLLCSYYQKFGEGVKKLDWHYVYGLKIKMRCLFLFGMKNNNGLVVTIQFPVEKDITDDFFIGYVHKF